MKQQRIYLDTSVIGGCFDEEFAPWSNGLVTDFRMGRFVPVVSELVAAEVDDAPPDVEHKFREIVALGAQVLSLETDVLELVDAYRNRDIISEKFRDDGVHIALATVNNVDVLVSWNFRHIVHYEKIRLFNSVNLESGYKELAIYSPREVAHHEER